ncbi:MAG: HAD-IIA family hydrolase [Anaerolineaceae bacterium]
MKDATILKGISAIMIDIDGTLLNGKQPLPGMVEFLNFLNNKSFKFLIISNNSTKTPQFYLEKFRNFGANILIKNILTCSSVTAFYIKQNFKGQKVFVIGENGIIEALKEQGFEIINDFSEVADFVVVGGDHFLTYDKIKYASLHLQNGAKFFGTNPDVASPSEEGLIPECGTNIAAVEAASGKKAVVIGKPNQIMFDWGIKQLGSQPSETAIIGDRLETDILGGNRAGLKTILVETGVDRSNSIYLKDIYPDLIVKDLFELIKTWETQLQNSQQENIS